MKASFFRDLLISISERSAAATRGLDSDRPADIVALATRLLTSSGDASGVAVASELIRSFDALDAAGKSRFFNALAEDFGPEPQRLSQAIEAYREQSTNETEVELHAAAEPRRQELIRRINLAPQGTAAVVRMRECLLERLPSERHLKALDADFSHLLSSWFNRGFLVLQPIDWNTPASILEKIIRYEAVHQIRDWDDLRNRIAPPDRRCYAFFHPALNDEPLIFVEVAFTQDMPANIAPILAGDRPTQLAEQAKTAVFYSISNCQRGLRGITFGNFIIKQVVEDLASELPNLEHFVTLSPIPGLMRWIRQRAQENVGGSASRLLRAVEGQDWLGDIKRQNRLRDQVLPLAAHYLTTARGRGGAPADPVARFHLGNGARLERINWLADESAKGLKESLGLMVNYRYSRPHIERNHEALANSGEVVAAPSVLELARSLTENPA